MASASPSVSLDEIRAAAARIAPYIHLTPMLTSRMLSAQAGCELLERGRDVCRRQFLEAEFEQEVRARVAHDATRAGFGASG